MEDQFVAIAGCDMATARQHLISAGGNLERALANYYDGGGGGGGAAPAPAAPAPGDYGDLSGLDAATAAAVRACMDEDQATASAAAGQESVVVCETSLPGGQTLQIRHGDLTMERAAAIVNPANKMLQHAGGLAEMMIQRGGFGIQQESKAHVDAHGKLDDGECAVTAAGDLPCDFVIHAVGPIWRGGPESRDNPQAAVLRLTVNNALRAAHERDMRSVALPAISTGKFNFPKPLCADIMLDAALEFFAAYPGSALRTIALTNFDDRTVDCFRERFDAAVARAPAQAQAPAPAPAPPAEAKDEEMDEPPPYESDDNGDEYAYDDDDDDDAEDNHPDLLRQVSSASSDGGYVYAEDEDDITAVGTGGAISVDVIAADVDELCSLPGLGAGFASAGNRTFVWIAFAMSRFALDRERAQAWGLNPSKRIALLIEFDQYYTLSSGTPRVIKAIQTSDENLNRKMLGDEVQFGLSWLVRDRVMNQFIGLGENWPPEIEERGGGGAGGGGSHSSETVSDLMEATGASSAEAIAALEAAHNDRSDAMSILLDDTQRARLNVAPAAPAAAAADEPPPSAFARLTRGLSRSNSTGGGGGGGGRRRGGKRGQRGKEQEAKALLASMLPAAPAEAIDAALALHGGDTGMAASQLVDMTPAQMREFAAQHRAGGRGAAQLQQRVSEHTMAEMVRANRQVETPLVGCNFLLRVVHFLEDKIRTVNHRCLVCDDPVEHIGLKPAVCPRQACIFGYEELGLGLAVDAEVAQNPEVVDLLITLAHGAAEQGRDNMIYPHEVEGANGATFRTASGKPDKALLKQVIDALPSILEMGQLGAQGRLREALDERHPLAYPLLRWLLASNRSHLRVLKGDERIPGITCTAQFKLMTGPMEKEIQFQRLKGETPGPTKSLFAHHGSAAGNWHTILRTGLKNYSNTAFMSAGAALGSGVYFADNVSTSMGYSSSTTHWRGSQFGAVSCMAICEIVNRTSEFTSAGGRGGVYVVPQEEYIVTRYFMLSPSGSWNASDLGLERLN